MTICGALRDLVAFVQFKSLKPATLLKLTLLHGCFMFFRLYKCYQIMQRIISINHPPIPSQCASSFHYFLTFRSNNYRIQKTVGIKLKIGKKQINPFNTSGLFLYHLKASENIWFSDAFRECGKRQVVLNGLR